MRSTRLRPLSQRTAAGICLVLVASFASLAAQAPDSGEDGHLGGYGHGEERPDPIEANGRIFVDWPKPDAALIFTGEQIGYLEPCGCAGLTNQKGGLKRRHTFLKQLSAEGWPLLEFDTGGHIRRFGAQAEIKLARSLESLSTLGYSAVGLGLEDLRLNVLSVVINLDEETNPLTSANVGILDFESGFTKRFRIAEAGGYRIGVTSVLGQHDAEQLKGVDDLLLVNPREALLEVAPQMQAENCDQQVLMVYGDVTESLELAKEFPQFDWVVVAKGADEPPHEPRRIDGTDNHLIEVGHKGMYAVTVGLYRDGDEPFRYQKVPLDHRFEDSPAMQQLLIDYQNDLKALGLEGLGLKPLPHPSGRQYAGSAVCGDCHTSAMEVFQNTPHSYATERLVKLDPPRHYDPECLSCHVTGWDPQGYRPYVSGYLSLDETPEMTTQGCEGCHGPGSEHVAIEMGEIDATDEVRDQRRAELRMEIVENEGNGEGQVLGAVVNNCLSCHDLDNSPDFNFDEYWEVVKHSGKD